MKIVEPRGGAGTVIVRNCVALAAKCVIAIFAVSILAVAAHAQTTVVYDDALQNGFDGPGYSFGGGFTFGDVTLAHTGANSVSILGSNFNALSLAHVPGGILTSLHVATTPILRFWVNGGTASGQQFHMDLQLNNAPVGSSAALDTYINGGGISAGVWRQVTIDLRQPPFNAVDFDRIDIQSYNAGTDASKTYFDDIVLGQPVVAPVAGIVYGQEVPVEGMNSETFTWQDSLGHSRTAALAYNDTTVNHAVPVNGSYGGALREYRFQLSNGQTRTATVTTYGNAGYGGFGYVTLHSSHYVGCVGNDDSPLGMGTPGTWERVFEGRHHAIFRFRQNYPRNCPTSGTIMTRYLPVTIDWIFSTGRDNPVWAVTYDVDQISDGVNPPVGPNMYYDDSRGPYGELNIDGDGWTDLNGVAWGDFYKFTTTNAAGSKITLDSPFDWTTSNTVPYVKEWLDGPLTAENPAKLDATMGIVQTQTIAQQDAGGARDLGISSDITPYWHKTQVDAVHSAGATVLPSGNNWPYQAVGNSLDYQYTQVDHGSNNARLTWKTQFGFIGQSTYIINNGAVESSAATAPGYPKKSYSTYIVLGQHTVVPEPVDAQVTQVETVQSLVLTASTGSVVTSGPAGITRADNVTYAPAGYNHVYGALAFNATGNQLDANIAVGSGTLKKPLIIVGNYTGSDPQVTFGGAALVADADYFASLRTNPNELWITLNRNLTGATNHLQISSTGAPAVPAGVTATMFSTTRIDVAWTASAGASSYQVDRMDSLAAGFVQIATPGTNALSDTTVLAGKAYMYRVRAVSGAGVSGNSNSDLATTIILTDAPVAAGTIVKAVHLDQLRKAVDAVRTLAGLGGGAYTDAAAAGTLIKAAHVTQLRTAIDAARGPLGLSTGGFTDSPLDGLPIKAVHFAELQSRVQ